jgi:serine/threonine protein kinase/Tol biopolymer transport system component
LIGGNLSHYELLEALREGEEPVWRARDTRTDRLVRLRLVARQDGADPVAAGAARGLLHSNLCSLEEVGEADGRFFLAWSWSAGETLDERLGRGPLNPEDTADLAVQIAAALSAAHARGLSHRRLEPGSILLAEGGWAKVLDLGLADLAGTGPDGSPWRAPKQRRGEPGDARADVWAVGALLHAMLTGRPPGPDGPEPLPLPEEGGFGKARMAEMARILARSLAPRPEDRPTDMEELLLELQTLVGTSSPSPRKSPGPGSATRPRAQQPRPPTGARRPAGLIGRVVDHYEIREPLGGGGMGVVYKAEDARLQRTIALKFLPPELTRDPVAKARFLQEARAASALDHPNICTIHEVGETDDGQLFLAMTCYDGETLKKKIERGPLPIDEAVDIARQIAAGLAKAHRQGIVHRDIKPANIMITDDGIVKILDFGLAKLAGAAGLTRAGFCLGTPAYMSPEQARGEVDHRTDLWSLGVVLYEMLAGAAPFSGDSDQAIIYALLTEDPKPLHEIRGDVPLELERILGGMLAKDPGDRYPTVDVALADLKILAGSTAGSSIQSLALARRRRRFPLWARIAAGAAGALALGLAAYVLLHPPQPVRRNVEPLTDLERREMYPSLSPDSSFFLYARPTPAGGFDIFWQRVGGGNPINLTLDSPWDDTQPATSPDGRQIAFRSERDGGGLFVMGATGESVVRLTAAGYNPAWSPDGREIVYATEGVTDPTRRSSRSALWRVDLTSRQVRKIFDGDAVQPSWSPNGRRIAFWGLPAGTARRAIWTIPAEGGEPVRVTPDDDFYYWNPVWSADGRHLYFISNRGGSMTLWRVPVSQRSGRTQGDLEAFTTPAQSSGFLSVSADGHHIAYATDESRNNLERVAFDAAAGEVRGDPEPVTQGSRAVRDGDVSPDGLWVTYDVSGQQEDLFLVGADGGSPRQLTDDVHKDRNPRWAPDGSRILFYSNRSGKYEAWTILPDGSGLARIASAPGTDLYAPIWSPDGRRLACGLGFGAAALLDLTRPEGARKPEILPTAGPGQYFAVSSWSPDGRWLAGVAQRENGASLPGLVLFSLETRRYERLNDRGAAPVWLRDSRRLLYLDGGRVFLLDTRTRQAREVDAPPAGSTYTKAGVSPDGRSLYLIRSTDEGDVWMLTME